MLAPPTIIIIKHNNNKVKKDEREMNKNLSFIFLAFLSVLFHFGTVLFICGKNYEIWNIS